MIRINKLSEMEEVTISSTWRSVSYPSLETAGLYKARIRIKATGLEYKIVWEQLDYLQFDKGIVEIRFKEVVEMKGIYYQEFEKV